MKPWHPGQFATGVVKKLEHDLQHVEHQIGADISHLAADLERRNKVDAFLRPLRRSPLGHTPAYTRMKALLDYQSSHGQDPQDFVRELQAQSKKIIQQHSYELSWARDYLRTLRSGNNPQRLKNEVIMPLRTGRISCREAWNRADSITGVQTLSNQQGQNNPTSQSTPRTPLIGGTFGFGFTIAGAVIVGGAFSAELLGRRYGTPGFYLGLEASLGAQLGLEADLILEVGFMDPADFGGWYVAGGVAAGEGVGGLVQVSWGLPPLVAAQPLIPQGFTLGGGIGVDASAAVAVGGGIVHLSS